tara:strand:+ start:1749 stop:1985 length:237 start_codon:yes stop_codon:yes gene_type:complete
MKHVIQITVPGLLHARHAVLEDNTIIRLRTNCDDGPDPIVAPGTCRHEIVVDAMRDRLAALQDEADQLERSLSELGMK